MAIIYLNIISILFSVTIENGKIEILRNSLAMFRKSLQFFDGILFMKYIYYLICHRLFIRNSGKYAESLLVLTFEAEQNVIDPLSSRSIPVVYESL